MSTEIWNDEYMDSEDDWYNKFVSTVHHILAIITAVITF